MNKKILFTLFISVIILLSFITGCSSFKSETVTQIYGTPVRIDYESYHSAIIYLSSGKPLYLRSEEPVVWETLLYSIFPS